MITTLFQLDDTCAWHEQYDESDAEAITVILTVDTKKLRHWLTLTSVEDTRYLNEILGGCRGLRVTFDDERCPQYCLELLHRDNQWIPFPAATFELDIRDLPRQ